MNQNEKNVDNKKEKSYLRLCVERYIITGIAVVICVSGIFGLLFLTFLTLTSDNRGSNEKLAVCKKEIQVRAIHADFSFVLMGGDLTNCHKYIANDRFHAQFVGINMPEKKEPFHTNATNEINHLLTNQTITGVTKTKFKTPEDEAKAYVHVNKKDVGETLLKKGYAYIKNPHELDPSHLKTYLNAQKSAQTNHIGIWSPDNFDSKWKTYYEKELNTLLKDL